MNKIKVSYFDIPKSSLDNVILSWWISRTEESVDLLKPKVKNLEDDERNGLLRDILLQDLPIREFVPVTFSIEGAPRSFWDQLDRSRDFAFWEQSLRVRDLENSFEFYTPDCIDLLEDEKSSYYYDAMREIQDDYKQLIKYIPREMARGIVPLHIVTRGSASGTLSSLLRLISKRTCYLAQGEYWRPVVQELLEGLWEAIPSLKNSGILTLPCTGKEKCQFELDLMYRINDRSNPVCPILIDKFCPENWSQKDLILEMKNRYSTYVKDSLDYSNSVRVKLSNIWPKLS